MIRCRLSRELRADWMTFAALTKKASPKGFGVNLETTRSPHWTREEAFFFQFQWHEELFDQFVKTRGELSSGSKPDYCFEKPGWFVPKELSAYEIWKTHTEEDVVLFRDVATKELFLYGCQV